MKISFLLCVSLSLLAVTLCFAEEKGVHVTSLAELARVAAGDGQSIRMEPGVYRMSDYLTPEVLAEIKLGVDRTQPRPPVPMFTFRGSGNHFDLRDVVIEIDTALYKLLPQGGYTRCLIIAGGRNTFDGLTLRTTGLQQGSGGNTLSVAGDGNVLENVTVHVHGSFPYGYGDLLGKGGPNLVNLQKQSGIQILGSDSTLRRCKVFSRALGHCFYIQVGGRIQLEDCYAEGVMRATTDMLRDTEGPAFDLGFRCVYENRDGRYVITPGYMKSLCEDGFRTYGNAGSVTLLNCTAVNTRAGFEIGAKDDAPIKTIVENCVARGCERAYLIGSQTIVRRCSGDAVNGPLLYLRGGRDSEVELELCGVGPTATVHALATVAGTGHRVRLTDGDGTPNRPQLPIMLGFGMPEHAEMSSPIRPATAKGITLINEIVTAPLITSDQIVDVKIESKSRTVTDAVLRASPGSWGLPANGIATGQSGK